MKVTSNPLTIYLLCCTLLFLTGQAMGNCICKVVFLDNSGELPQKLYLFDGTKNHLLQAKSASFSEPINLTKDTTSIEISSDIIDPTITKTRNFVSEKIPTKATKIYIIVSSDSSKLNPLQKIHILNASESEMKPGDTIWINLSDYTVRAQIRENRAVFEKQGKKITNPTMEKPGYYKVEFDYQYSAEKEFLPLLRKTWWHNPKKKYLGIIVAQGGKLPRIYKIQDSPPIESIDSKQ